MEQIKKELLEDEATIKLALLQFKILLLKQQIREAEPEKALPDQIFIADETDYDLTSLKRNNNNLAGVVSSLESRISKKRHQLIKAAFEVFKKDQRYKLELLDQHLNFPILTKFIFDVRFEQMRHICSYQLRGTAC